MDKLQMAINLLQEAQEEKERLKEYELDHAVLGTSMTNEEHHEAFCKFYEKWHGRHSKPPKKQHINDNIKMARRLLLDEYV